MKLIKITCLAMVLLLCFASILSCGGNQKKYVILEETLSDVDPYGIGFRKGDNDLTVAVQELLDAMIADGTFKEIAARWFDSDVIVPNAQWPREITATGDGSLEYIKNKGEFILGLDETFAPMGFRDKDGNIVGFDIDLAKEVCSRMGVELKLQPISWDAKEMELSTKSIDCIWNGMSATPERVEAMNISKPYLVNRQVIVVAEDSGIKTKADLAGKKVATQSDSSALESLNNTPDFVATFADLIEYAKYDDAWLDLKAGSVDAIAIDEVLINYYLGNE